MTYSLKTSVLLAMHFSVAQAFAPGTIASKTLPPTPKLSQPSASTLVDYDPTVIDNIFENGQPSSCPFSSLADSEAETSQCPISQAKEAFNEGFDNLASFGRMMKWSAQELISPQPNTAVPFIAEGKTPLGFAGDLQFAGSDQVVFLESKFESHPNAKGYTTTLGGVPFLALSDMASIKQVLRERPTSFERVISSAVPEKVGLTFAAGDTWRQQRKLLAPSFREKEVQKLTTRIAEIADQVVTEVERQSKDGQSVDFYQISSIMAMSVAAKTAGLNVNLAKDNFKNYHSIPFFSQVIEDFREKAANFVNDPFQALLSVECPSLTLAEKLIPKHREAIEAVSEMYQFPQEYLQILQHGGKEAFVEQLCEKNGWDMETEQSALIDQLLTMEDGHLMVSALAIVGFFSLDSTTAQIMWILYELAKNPKMYERLREEIMAAANNDDDRESFAISQFPFMEACIAEAERLHPVFEGIVDASMAVKDFEVHGRKMPKGTVVVGMKKLAMQKAMQEDGFDNLDSFDPLRFIKRNNGDMKMDRGLWKKYNLGFGGGPRECPGQHLFKYETMLLLKELALRFDRLDFDEVTCGVNGEGIGETLQGALRPTKLNLRLYKSGMQIE